MLVALARQSGQSFLELLRWDPRDVATLVDLLDDERRAYDRATRG